MSKDNLRDGRVKNWFYLENELLDREDLTIYEKTVYIVIARYVNGENKAFPSYETIANKGSMSRSKAKYVVNSLVQKGLLKKEFRKSKDNNCYTSNLYTLLNPKTKDKKGVGHVVTYPRSYSDLPLGHDVTPNNTSIKKTNLNNVNKAGNKRGVENSGEETKEEILEDEENINDIRKKINESLKENRRCDFTDPKDSEKERKSLESNVGFKSKYSNNSMVDKYAIPGKYRPREKELLAREIAEELNDNHSLGAFRAVADKIPEQQIRIFLSIIRDTYLTGKIKKSRGAMFISLARAYAVKNSINLNFK